MTEAVQGHTRWGRFAVIMVPCAVVIAAMAAALLNGILAASIAVAGVPLQLNVSKLTGSGLTLYANEIQPVVGDTLPVAVAGSARHDRRSVPRPRGRVPVLGQVGIKASSRPGLRIEPRAQRRVARR